MSLINSSEWNTKFHIPVCRNPQQNQQHKTPRSVKATHCQVQQSRRKINVRAEFLAVKHHLKPTSCEAVSLQDVDGIRSAVNWKLPHSGYCWQQGVQHSKLLLHKHVKASLYHLLLPESNRSSQIQLYHLKYNKHRTGLLPTEAHFNLRHFYS